MVDTTILLSLVMTSRTIGYKNDIWLLVHLVLVSQLTEQLKRSTNYVEVWSLLCLGVDSCDQVLREYTRCSRYVHRIE